jgi:Rad3-related DNA helicase
MYVAAGVMLGDRTIILTSTKGLQSQLMSDFEEIGMVDVRGKNSYRCHEAHDRLTCDQGMCNFGMFCPLRKGGCAYYDAVIAARTAPLVVTNYSFWLYSNKYGEGIGKAGLLVCDEGHDAPAEVASFLEVKLDRSDEILMQILPREPQHLSILKWREWAKSYASTTARDVEQLQSEIQEDGPDEHTLHRLARLKKLQTNLTTLAGMDIDNWVCNITPFDIEFAPISVSDQCQDILFRDSKRGIITSASVNYKTAEMLGLHENEYTLDEYPHTFPVESRMVYLLRGGRMNSTADGETLNEWLKMADSVIEARLDRKGIFHTTAYHRRDFVITHSQFAPYMMSHNRRDVVDQIQRFKESAPPKILVSPSVTTGYDFPGSECEYQILGKLPYPDTRNVITKARCDHDPEYAPYIAMQQIIQACGRGSRSEDDRCENFIIDNNFGDWFLKRYRKFAPQWFLDSITARTFPPTPPERLERSN